jgi:hypothetical protein
VSACALLSAGRSFIFDIRFLFARSIVIVEHEAGPVNPQNVVFVGIYLMAMVYNLLNIFSVE